MHYGLNGNIAACVLNHLLWSSVFIKACLCASIAGYML